jgi:hypothetical protein
MFQSLPLERNKRKTSRVFHSQSRGIKSSGSWWLFIRQWWNSAPEIRLTAWLIGTYQNPVSGISAIFGAECYLLE